MEAKISSLTILSEDVYALGRYYEAFFQMRPLGAAVGAEPVSLTDGRVRLDIKPRLTGDPAQLHCFGIEVDDIDSALSRMGEIAPTVEWLEESAGVQGRAVAAHDPAGNIFILTEAGGAAGPAHDRVVDHFGLRVRHPRETAVFYTEVFGFSPLDGPAGDGTIYLSCGDVTMVIIPWRMSDFLNTGITARGMDHLGFRVENIDAFKADIDSVTECNFRFRPSNTVVGRGREGAGRLAMFQRTCPLGRYHLADYDGLLVDVRE